MRYTDGIPADRRRTLSASSRRLTSLQSAAIDNRTGPRARVRTAIVASALVLLVLGANFAQGARIKDIARVRGARDNQLLGYGLVVGLEGTGDTAQTIFTTQAVANMLQSLGVTVPAALIKVKNVAAVTVTADLPPFVKPGDRIDVVVSSLGDARTLQGGTLLQTPLTGADSRVYAVAQGAVSIGGFSAAGGGARVTKNHPTVGRVPLGALVEQEVPSTFMRDGVVSIALNQPDFATAARIVRAVDRSLGEAAATAVDAATVDVAVPADYRERVVDFIAQVGLVTVVPDAPAKVVINEKTGTVVVGGNVRIAPVAVSHGALTVEVDIYYDISQPTPFSERGHTVVRPIGEATAQENEATLAEVSGTTLQQLVRSLNAIKVTPRDLIAILQAIKQSGALQAELEIL